MFLVNIAEPWTLLVVLFLTVCFIYIGKEAKNAYVTAVPLVAFLVLLVMHGIQFLILPVAYESMTPDLLRCLLVDFIMIFVTYASYLWIDDIEARAKNKKSLDNSLDWLWKKV